MNPAAAYLSRLESARSRRTMEWALDTLAALVTSGRANAFSLPWQQLRAVHTRALRAKLAGQYAPATANLLLSALRGVLEESWRLGLMDADDYRRAADLKNVRGSRVAKGRALAAHEVTALFTACDGSLAGRRNAALLAVLLGCGLRRAELIALDLDDYDAGAGSLVVRGKGNKERIVYLPDAATPHLRAWLALRGDQSGPLFLPVNKADRLQERRLSGSAVWDILSRLAARAGVAEFAPHDLRRSFISALLSADVDLHTVSQMAGHAGVAVTARYDKRGEDTKRRAANLLRLPE